MNNYLGKMRRNTTTGFTVGAAAFHSVTLTRNHNGGLSASGVDVPFPIDRAPHPAEIEQAVMKAVGADRGDKIRICTGLPPHEAGLHLFQVPFDSSEKVRQVLTFEAEPLFLTPAEQLNLDFAVLDPDMEPKPLGAVFGAQPEIVASLAAELKSFGCDPDYILPEQLALLAVGRYLIESTLEACPVVLIDLGGTHTSMAVFENGRPVLIRSVFYGGRDITLKLAESMDIEFYEAEQTKFSLDISGSDPGSSVLAEAWQPLFIEIERSLTVLSDVAEGRDPKIIIGGGGARTQGLILLMKNSFGLEVESFDRILPVSTPEDTIGPESMTPFGLALLPIQPGYLPNLRTDDRSAIRLWQKYRAPAITMIACLFLVGILALAQLYYSYSVQRDRYLADTSEVNRIFKETAPQITQVLDRVKQLRQEVESATQAVRSSQSGGRILDILLDVSKLAGSHEGLRITELAIGAETVELQGEGGSFETVERLKAELADLSYFSEASGGGGRKDPNTNMLSFKITLRRSAS